MSTKFKVGDRVKNISYPQDDLSNPWPYLGRVGTITSISCYYRVKFDIDETVQLFHEKELELAGASGTDCAGNEIRVGDIIVYFTRSGSCLDHQKARVEHIGIKKYNSPHILVLKEDAVQKDLFTRKSWLWSFDNSVKVG